jgi:hypothetical protein
LRTLNGNSLSRGIQFIFKNKNIFAFLLLAYFLIKNNAHAMRRAHDPISVDERATAMQVAAVAAEITYE